jgi:hypothetical protein
MSRERHCAVLIRAKQLAEERDLNAGSLKCPYIESCLGTVCEYSEQENFRTIHIKLSGVTKSSQQEKFFKRLQAHKSLIE